MTDDPSLAEGIAVGSSWGEQGPRTGSVLVTRQGAASRVRMLTGFALVASAGVVWIAATFLPWIRFAEPTGPASTARSELSGLQLIACPGEMQNPIRCPLWIVHGGFEGYQSAPTGYTTLALGGVLVLLAVAGALAVLTRRNGLRRALVVSSWFAAGMGASLALAFRWNGFEVLRGAQLVGVAALVAFVGAGLTTLGLPRRGSRRTALAWLGMAVASVAGAITMIVAWTA